MKILSGQYVKESKVLTDTSAHCEFFASDMYCITVFGRITFGFETVSGDSLFELWKKYGDEIVNHIEGIYVAAFYDKNTRDFRIYQDRSSSPVALYYTESNGILYYSTSLMELLKASGIERSLNESKLGDFLTNGYIVGDNTLVANVYKLRFFSCLTVENGAVVQKKLEYKINEMSVPEAAEKWTNVLDSSIRDAVSGDTVYSPLSGGYDSNYIVYVENRDFDMPVKCFSIGGKSGKNELPAVEENAKIYPKVELKSALTDEKSLESFPDIVFRLEGAVFESGLFLQYSLAKLINDNNVPYLICGECADQVMNDNYYMPEKMCDEYGEKNKYYDFAEYPMAYGHYVILKKSGILLNSYGIEGRYPFIDKRMYPVAKALSCINKKDKRFHVATCEKCLDGRIIGNIMKIGGATDVHSIFANKQEIKRFVDFVKESELYKKYGQSVSLGSMFASVKEKEANKEKLRRVVYALAGKKIEKDYYWEEIALRELLCYTYVILFEKLFISGKYDDKGTIKEGLYDIIKN